MVIEGVATNTTVAKQNVLHENLNKGFDLWQNGNDFALAPFNLEGASTYTEGDIFPEAGFDWVIRCPRVEGHNGAESLFDYTNGGANTEIPSSFNVHNPRTSPIIDSKYFSAVKRDADNNVLSENKILIYSIAPTGDCLEKTIEWYGDDYVFETDEEGNYLIDEENNVIIE